MGVNVVLDAWVADIAALCTPDARALVRRLAGRVRRDGPPDGPRRARPMRLDDGPRPNSILVRSHPADVARVEERTFICSVQQGGRRARPTTGRTRPR